ncbi:MAG: FAD/NAD(P)-binding protein [Myxococcota bacterium]
MPRHITRRDFLNGTQVAIGASLLGGCRTPPRGNPASAPRSPFALDAAYYPPAKTGLRGSHDGSWEAMHLRTQGHAWPRGAPEETYDLVVVGGGISGLSAAHFYRQAKPGARVLILDNHDDFGGHAKRNEFEIGEQTRIGYGGTESIDTPSSYSEVAKQLLVDVGIDTDRFYEAFDQKLYDSLGLGKGILFDQETFGAQKLAVGYNKVPWEEFVAQTPLNAKARADLVRIWTDKRDYLPGLTLEEKLEKLSRVSYETFLRDYAKVDPEILEMYRRWGISFWCVGIDEIPAPLVLLYDGGMPGLDHTLSRSFGNDPIGERGAEPYIFHFPDGNASIARLLVRGLIPGAVPGSTMEDVVTARVDYSRLDRPGQAVRLRLNSTVVEAQHTADGEAVDVTFVHGGDPHTVRGQRCIMACYNSAIPYIVPTLPEAQKAGLAYGVKVPLTYTKVLVPNWRPMAELGLNFVYYTKDFYKQVELDYPVSLGSYRRSQTPDEPMILHMCHVAHYPDIKGPEQWREGRRHLLTTPFSTFEHHVRDQLDQALGSAGFDADRDIHAITVNRWSHGYAYNPVFTWEPEYAREEDKPWVQGRQPFGRISIANSDAGADSNTPTAIDQAHRAVQECLESEPTSPS